MHFLGVFSFSPSLLSVTVTNSFASIPVTLLLPLILPVLVVLSGVREKDTINTECAMAVRFPGADFSLVLIMLCSLT